MFTDDPIRDYFSWDYEQAEKIKNLPICCECGDPIIGEYMWEFEGFLYCEDCVQKHRKDVTYE